MPNIKELRSVADSTKLSPAVDIAFFPGTQQYPYWSSTTYSSVTSDAWTIDFKDGGTSKSDKKVAAGIYARCVRDR